DPLGAHVPVERLAHLGEPHVLVLHLERVEEVTQLQRLTGQLDAVGLGELPRTTGRGRIGRRAVTRRTQTEDRGSVEVERRLLHLALEFPLEAVTLDLVGRRDLTAMGNGPAVLED